MAGEDVSNEALSDEQIDKLVDSSESARNSERPMTAQPETPAKDTTPPEVFEFDHGGKKIKGNREQFLKWAQMGYDRPQVMQKFNQDKQKWETDKQAWEKNWGVYKEIDDYAKGNQQWWNWLQQQWNTRSTYQQQQTNGGAPTQGQGQQIPANDPKYHDLENKLNTLNQFVSQFQQEREENFKKTQDDKLSKDIQSIRDQHKDLDWESIDENGKSLEVRVLEHAKQNSIPTFKAAFRDLLHEDLIQQAQTRAKLDVAKGIQNNTKLGVLGSSPTPKSWMPKPNKNIRKTSYEDLENEIREEIRQGRV